MKEIIQKANEKLVQLYVQSQTLLMDKSGASFMDFIVYLVIVIVIGGLVLAGLKLLFNETIFPGATSKLDAMWS